MDEHISFLKTGCHFCGNQVEWKRDVANKQSFKLELWLRFQINVDVDNDEIYPSVLSEIQFKKLIVPRENNGSQK